MEKAIKNTDTKRKMVPDSLVADVVGCGRTTVTEVRNGNRSKDTDLGQTIQIADMLLEEGMNKLINEVKRVVKF